MKDNFSRCSFSIHAKHSLQRANTLSAVSLMTLEWTSWEQNHSAIEHTHSKDPYNHTDLSAFKMRVKTKAGSIAGFSKTFCRSVLTEHCFVYNIVRESSYISLIRFYPHDGKQTEHERRKWIMSNLPRSNPQCSDWSIYFFSLHKTLTLSAVVFSTYLPTLFKKNKVQCCYQWFHTFVGSSTECSLWRIIIKLDCPGKNAR